MHASSAVFQFSGKSTMASSSSTSTNDFRASASSESTQDTNEVQVISLLDKLHRPTSSQLSRKRKIALNPPPIGAKKSKGITADDPKTITPSVRMKQYPNEHLTVTNKNLALLVEKHYHSRKV